MGNSKPGRRRMGGDAMDLEGSEPVLLAQVCDLPAFIMCAMLCACLSVCDCVHVCVTVQTCVCVSSNAGHGSIMMTWLNNDDMAQ